MPDFFAQLAKRSLGLTPLVRPRVVSHFAMAKEPLLESEAADNPSTDLQQTIPQDGAAKAEPQRPMPPRRKFNPQQQSSQESVSRTKDEPRDGNRSVSGASGEPPAKARPEFVTSDPRHDESDAFEKRTLQPRSNFSSPAGAEEGAFPLLPQATQVSPLATSSVPLSSAAAKRADAALRAAETNIGTPPDSDRAQQSRDAADIHHRRLSEVASQRATETRGARHSVTSEASESEQRRLRDVYVPLVVEVASQSMEEPLDKDRLARAVEEAAESKGIEADQSRNVSVSIGRVEVQAAQPPAPQPARWTPTLSLDQYLEQRNKGQR